MIATLRYAADRFFGARDAAVTVPPMDGALQPDTRLETADVLCAAEAPDNIVAWRGDILISGGGHVRIISPGGEMRVWRDFGAGVSAMAADARGTLAVALAGKGVRVIAADGTETGFGPDAFPGAGCITAMAWEPSGNLWLASGSPVDGPDDWSRNLMSRRRDGALWLLSAGAGAPRRIANDLAWPAGILPCDGQVLVSEAWNNRIIAIPVGGGASKVVLDRLPAYPGRLHGAGADVWLCCFAPRSQLVEFVLREKQFREMMLAEIEPDYWMAPALRSGRSFREPLQGGAVKQLGMLKPWAPTRSYGLLVRLGADLLPVESFHSRADGRRHGITSCLVSGDHVFVTSTGGDVVLSLRKGGSR